MVKLNGTFYTKGLVKVTYGKVQPGVLIDLRSVSKSNSAQVLFVSVKHWVSNLPVG